MNSKGFTLMETMVALTIFVFVMILAGNFIVTGFKSYSFTSEQETAIQHARRVTEAITKELRGTNSSELGAYPLETVESQNLVFYSDINDDGLMERVNYYLDSGDNTIKKSVILPDGSNQYTIHAATTTIAEYINNQTEALFNYYDADMATTTAVNEIRLVNISVKVNVTPTVMPNDYYVEADVQLRNLKDNL